MADRILVDSDQVGVALGKLLLANAAEPLNLAFANAGFLKLKVLTEEITLAGAADTLTVSPPAGSIVLYCTAVITVAITGASGFDLGDGTDQDRWGAISQTAVGQKALPSSASASSIVYFASAPVITLTAKTSDFTAGKIRVQCVYLEAQGPQN